MLGMFSSIFGVNKNIIKEDSYKFMEEGSKKFIHFSLKGGWCICKSKGEYFPLIMSKVCSESCQWYRVRVHRYLVVSTHKVKFSKHSGAL